MILNKGVPLGAKISFGIKTEMNGVWRSSLQHCSLFGLHYNSLGTYIELLDDVWKDKERITLWVNSITMSLNFVPSKNEAMVWKNNELLSNDSWQWIHNDIKLNNDIYREKDIWEVSYEQKKEIITPAINFSIIPMSKKPIIDGHIFQKYKGYLKEFDITENIVFNNKFQTKLVTAWCLDKKGTLKTREGRVVVGWKFLDEKNIKIEPHEYRANEEYIISYKGVWGWHGFTGIEIYCSQNGGLFKRIEMESILDRHNQYQIKVIFRKEIKAGDIRVRSLVIKILEV